LTGLAADFGVALEAVFFTAGFVAALSDWFPDLAGGLDVVVASLVLPTVLTFGATALFVAGLLMFLAAFVAGLVTAEFMASLI